MKQILTVFIFLLSMAVLWVLAHIVLMVISFSTIWEVRQFMMDAGPLYGLLFIINCIVSVYITDMAYQAMNKPEPPKPIKISKPKREAVIRLNEFDCHNQNKNFDLESKLLLDEGYVLMGTYETHDLGKAAIFKLPFPNLEP